MQISWRCKHGNVEGEVDPPLGSTLPEVRQVVRESHDKACRVGGHTWMLIDAEGPGYITPNGAFNVPIEASGRTMLIVFHVQ